MAKTKKHEMHTYTADVQLVEQNGIYFIYKNGERYIGPILPADAGIMLASVHEVLAKEWVAGREAARWLTLVSLVAMLGFAGIAEQMDKLSPGPVAGMFLSVLAFGVCAELGGLTYKGDRL